MSRADIERLACVLGEQYDGYTDPVDTPSNYARAVSGVRAILQALREPSEGMLGEGQRAASDHLDHFAGAESCATSTWQAMIDHLLSD